MTAWLVRTLGLALLGAWLGAFATLLLTLAGDALGSDFPLVPPLVLGAGLGLLFAAGGPRWVRPVHVLAVLFWAGLLARPLGGVPLPKAAWLWWSALGAWGLFAGPWVVVWLRAAAPILSGAALGALLPRLAPGLELEQAALALGLLTLGAGLHTLWKRRRVRLSLTAADLSDPISGAEDELAQPQAPLGSAYGRRLITLLFLALGLPLVLAAMAWLALPVAHSGALDRAPDLALACAALALGLGLARWAARFLHPPFSLDVSLWLAGAALVAALGGLGWAGQGLGAHGARLFPAPLAGESARLVGFALPLVALGFIAQTLLALFVVWMRGVALLALGLCLAVPRLWLVELGWAPVTLGAAGVALLLVFVGGERAAPDVGRVWSPWLRRALGASRLGMWAACAGLVAWCATGRAGFGVVVEDGQRARGLLAFAWSAGTTTGAASSTGAATSTGAPPSASPDAPRADLERFRWVSGRAPWSVAGELVRRDLARDRDVVRRAGELRSSAADRDAIQRAATRIGTLLGTPAPALGLALEAGPLDFTQADAVRRAWLARGAALYVVHLPLDAPAARVWSAVDAVGQAVPWASLWFEGGRAFLVAGPHAPPLDLAAGAAAHATLGGFVGEVVRPELAATVAPATPRIDLMALFAPGAPTPTGGSPLRHTARNLESLAAARTAWPMDWTLLLGSAAPAIQARSRAELSLHIAGAWVAHARAEAPGSIALESWQGRLLEARADVQAFLAADPELARFEGELAAEDALATARRELTAERPAVAVGLLLNARRALGPRGDLDVRLAAALQLAGEHEAAANTWRELGARGPALLAGSEAWLMELGFTPPASPWGAGGAD